MSDKSLWTKEQEIDFFTKSLQIASPEQLFYRRKIKGIMLTDLKITRGLKPPCKAEMRLSEHTVKSGLSEF